MDDVLHRLLDIAVELVSRLARERDVQPGVCERRVLLDGRPEELVGFLGTCDVRELLAGQKIYWPARKSTLAASLAVVIGISVISADARATACDFLLLGLDQRGVLK
jgi:hypothetical protein